MGGSSAAGDAAGARRVKVSRARAIIRPPEGGILYVRLPQPGLRAWDAAVPEADTKPARRPSPRGPTGFAFLKLPVSPHHGTRVGLGRLPEEQWIARVSSRRTARGSGRPPMPAVRWPCSW